MRIKLDENLSRHLKDEITAFGHDVDTVADENMLSQVDGQVAEAAKAAGRMLLTLDLDFSDIRRFPPGTHHGIVLFRPASFGVNEVKRYVLAFIAQTDLDSLVGSLIVVDPNRVRVRRPTDDATN